MSKKAFDKIAAGLNEAIAIARMDRPTNDPCLRVSRYRLIQAIVEVIVEERDEIAAYEQGPNELQASYIAGCILHRLATR